MPNIANVIKYEGDARTLIWKHPCEDFNALTQLIVHESQEAIFCMNGQALDLFGPGRHTLNTESTPLIGKALKRATGGESPFHCEVYFINKTEQPGLLFGTDSKVQYLDPTYQFPIELGASGELSFTVTDARRLFLRLVGTLRRMDARELLVLLRGPLMARLKSYLAEVMGEGIFSIFELDAHLTDLSATLRERLLADFAAFGISLGHFFITTVSRPDGERQYEQFKALHFRRFTEVEEARLRQAVDMIDAETAAERALIEADARAKRREREGYTWAQERGFDVAEKAAQNEGVGQLTGLGIGLGAMAGVGQTVSGMMNTAASAANTQNAAPVQLFCENCGAKLAPDAIFCESCGARLAPATHCKTCGHAFTRPGNYCPKCGTEREDR